MHTQQVGHAAAHTHSELIHHAHTANIQVHEDYLVTQSDLWNLQSSDGTQEGQGHLTQEEACSMRQIEPVRSQHTMRNHLPFALKYARISCLRLDIARLMVATLTDMHGSR